MKKILAIVALCLMATPTYAFEKNDELQLELETETERLNHNMEKFARRFEENVLLLLLNMQKELLKSLNDTMEELDKSLQERREVETELDIKRKEDK